MIELTEPRIAEKIGFSHSLNPNSISAYHDAARYKFPELKRGRKVRRAFMRGWGNGYITLHAVKKEIGSGVIVFKEDTGAYDDLLSGRVHLAEVFLSDEA